MTKRMSHRWLVNAQLALESDDRARRVAESGGYPEGFSPTEWFNPEQLFDFDVDSVYCHDCGITYGDWTRSRRATDRRRPDCYEETEYNRVRAD